MNTACIESGATYDVPFGHPSDQRPYADKLTDFLAACARPAQHDCEPIHPSADVCRCGAPIDLARTA